MATLTVCEQAALDLADARAALKTTLLGGAVTRVTSYGRTKEYSAANRIDLLRYIRGLETIVADCAGENLPAQFIRMQPGDDN